MLPPNMSPISKPPTPPMPELAAALQHFTAVFWFVSVISPAQTVPLKHVPMEPIVVQDPDFINSAQEGPVPSLVRTDRSCAKFVSSVFQSSSQVPFRHSTDAWACAPNHKEWKTSSSDARAMVSRQHSSLFTKSVREVRMRDR